MEATYLLVCPPNTHKGPGCRAQWARMASAWRRWHMLRIGAGELPSSSVLDIPGAAISLRKELQEALRAWPILPNLFSDVDHVLASSGYRCPSIPLESGAHILW